MPLWPKQYVIGDIVLPRKKTLYLVTIVLVFTGMVTGAIIFNNYVYSYAWHFANGSKFEFQGFRLHIPLQWWAKQSVDQYRTFKISKAGLIFTVIPSQITISPTIPGEVGRTDEEESFLIRKLVASERKDGPSGSVVSEVKLRTQKGMMYCLKDIMLQDGGILRVNIHCNIVNVPYTFSYFGSARSAPKAESILSTLQ